MPVVISGETGCGKSSLISRMCGILEWPLDVLNVHSGLSYSDIAAWVEERARACEAKDLNGDGRVSVILLDEINACSSVGEVELVYGSRFCQQECVAANLYEERFANTTKGLCHSRRSPRKRGFCGGLNNNLEHAKTMWLIFGAF